MSSLFRPCLKVIIVSLAANCGSDALLTYPSPGAGERNAVERRGPVGIPGTCTCYSRSKAPKLTIFSATFGLQADYVESIRENRAILADAYDYEYCEFNVSDIAEKRAPAWAKVRAIQILLERGRRRIAAMDADAFFVKKMPFEDVRKENGSAIFELGKDVILTDDHPQGDPCNINTGVMVMNNSQWTKDFWQGVWDMHGTTPWMPLADQSGVCVWRKRNRDDFNKHVAIIEHELMNNVGCSKGKFIAHKAGGGSGGDPGNKYKLLKPTVEKANKNMSGTTERHTSSKFKLTDKFQVMY